MRSKKLKGRCEIKQAGIGYRVIRIWHSFEDPTTMGTYASLVDATIMLNLLQTADTTKDFEYKIIEIDFHTGKLR